MGFPTICSEFTLPEPVLRVLSILGRLGLSDFLQPDIVWPDNPPRQTTSESATLTRRKSLPVVKFEELVVVVGGDQRRTVPFACTSTKEWKRSGG
ncbi:hypothetical protein V6N13_068817 [Hibiscus sabdariffa]|uniref:Uncharacterized protein n=1 Tax=Hibiscus sabdariffa TaxID=183260 RepID=A0ABR2QPB5_9ROSI